MTLFVLTNMVVRNMHDLQSNLTRTVLVQQALDQESGHWAQTLIYYWWPDDLAVIYIKAGEALALWSLRVNKAEWTEILPHKANVTSVHEFNSLCNLLKHLRALCPTGSTFRVVSPKDLIAFRQDFEFYQRKLIINPWLAKVPWDAGIP